MTLPSISMDNVMKILLALSQYPILSGRIRSQMRKVLFARGIITRENFDAEAHRKAIESQQREGLHNPFAEEESATWEKRLKRVRASLTDFYFAYNLPYEEFENIVRQTLVERGSDETEFVWFNPELAPQDVLIEQAEAIEAMPPEERRKYEARLKEIKVVLIRTIISDQLKYIRLARRWFTIQDLKEIRSRKVGGGKVGGKAAGMLLAMRIIQENTPPEVRECFRIPVSYYVGSDVFYNFMSLNDLMHWNDQKYKDEDQMRADFPAIRAEFSRGQFPPEIIERFEEIIKDAGNTPLIVRSSSLLEDNFGTSFAGKYESIFLPNQGSTEEKLHALTQAISRIYSSVLDPDALLYRHHKELADYDERIGILIQFVEGQTWGRYYFPHGAGVGFSRNMYRWAPQIRQEDGFLRLVWGLGTRAVDVVSDDYPRLVALSHPALYTTADFRQRKRYSQQSVEAIDLEANQMVTLNIHDLLDVDYPPLRFIAQVEEEGYLANIRSRAARPEKMVINFDGLLSRTAFAANIRTALKTLEMYYDSPVDTEFTLRFINPDDSRPTVEITLLQCRPQSHIKDEAGEVLIPQDLKTEDILFSTTRMVPQGIVEKIRYVLYVPSEGYFNLASQSERSQLERAIGQLNTALQNETYIAVGPGRWGTSTPDLGVHVAYSDIYNARALVELAGDEIGASPEPSFGTHFFQDLMEAKIHPLAVFLDDEETIFNRDFFRNSPNRVTDFISIENPRVMNALHLIAVEDHRPAYYLNLLMDSNKSRAVAFFKSDPVEIAQEEDGRIPPPTSLE